MAQIKSFSWTNPATAVARNLDVGFTVAEVTTVDITNGGSWFWCDTMSDAYALDVDAGTIATSNGFTPYADNSNYGATVSGFTNASPGVITCTDTSLAGFAVGDTIKVTGVADDQTGTVSSLNSTYVIASLTATTITTATDTSVTDYGVYVSGGKVTRVTDVDGVAVPVQNVAQQGITCGTTGVGANNAVMVAIVKGKESVT